MANTTLTQTGAQVQAILDKADELPASLGTAGQVLKVNSGGTGLEWAIDNDTGLKIPTITFPSSGNTLTNEQIAILSNNEIIAQVDSNGKWLTFWYKDHTSLATDLLAFVDIAMPNALIGGNDRPPYVPLHQFLSVNLDDNTFYIGGEDGASGHLHGSLSLSSSAVISTNPLTVTLTSEEAVIVDDSDLLYIDPSDLGFNTTVFVSFAWVNLSNNKKHFYSIIPTISTSVFEVYHIIFTPGSNDTATLQLEEGTFTIGDMSNPMTTAGDLIVGGSSGAPTRLAQGSTGQVLKVGSNGPEWANESGGSFIPTVTITQSQVISQDPVQVQLTQAQCDILNANQQVNFDFSAFGYIPVIMFKNVDGNSKIEFTIVAGANSIPDHVSAYYIEADKTTSIATYHHYAVNSYGVDGTTIQEEWSSTDYAQLSITGKLPYLTTAPTSANTTGTVEIVVLSSEPAQRYSGYLYIITGSN